MEDEDAMRESFVSSPACFADAVSLLGTMNHILPTCLVAPYIYNLQLIMTCRLYASSSNPSSAKCWIISLRSFFFFFF
jgi:hypothetical protein